jgi:ribosomal protein S18 acetylase RimI-like enzyme
MSKAPVPLTPVRVAPSDKEFLEILKWPFATAPFYEAQVQRLLQSDIPQRFAYGFASLWIYNEPKGQTVGFGTLDLCGEYSQLTGGKPHSYIPVLAVHPHHRGSGYGRTIVDHLIAEAVLIAQHPTQVSDQLFLDVYQANQGAVSLYLKAGFSVLNANSPVIDPAENNEPYLIMAKHVAISSP